METESVKLEMCKDRKRLIKLPCASADGGACHADDPVLAAWTAKTCSTTDYDTKKAEWETARRKHTDL